MDQQLIGYFKKGFALTNKSWDLFAIGLVLSLLFSIPDLLGDFYGKWVLQILGFLTFLIAMGFSFSTAAFLLDKQKGKRIGLSNILSITMGNAKRLILPLLLVFILFIFGVVFMIIIFGAFGAKPDFSQITQGRWRLLVTVCMGLFSFTSFTSIYFSIEKNGFFKSTKKSIMFGFKNLDFILFVYIATVTVYAIHNSFFNNNQIWYQILLRSILNQYSELVITATSLILYQNRKGLKA